MAKKKRSESSVKTKRESMPKIIKFIFGYLLFLIVLYAGMPTGLYSVSFFQLPLMFGAMFLFASAFFGGYFALILGALIMLIIPVILLITAIGLIKLKNWSRITASIFFALFAICSLFTLIFGGISFFGMPPILDVLIELIFLILNVLGIVLLNLKKVKGAFR